MNNFINFTDIDVKNERTWRGKCILTLDTDWAIDPVLEYCYNIIKRYKIKASIFLTNETKVLKEIKQNPLIEVGMHPNFNKIFNGEPDTVENILKKIKKVAKKSEILRSHCLTTSASWYPLYKKYGIKYTSNFSMIGHSNISPIVKVNGIIECPIFFADDAFLLVHGKFSSKGIKRELMKNNSGLRVLLFHPIHVFLNSKSLSAYEKIKPFYHDITKLKQSVNTKEMGSLDALNQAIELLLGD